MSWLPLAGGREWRRGLVVLSWLLLTALLSAPRPVAATEEAQPPLLYRLAGNAPRAAFAAPAVVAAAAVEIDTALLGANPPVIGLPLPDGGLLVARDGRLERRSADDITWRGTVDGLPFGRAVITSRHGVVVGVVLGGSDVILIEPTAGANEVVTILDQSLFPDCAGPLERGGGSAGLETQVAAEADSGDRVDVMILYTPQARDAAGGVAAIEATAQAAVDAGNTAFADSGVTTRFRLVHTALANHSDAGDLYTDLPWLVSDATAASLRDSYGADLVSLLVNDGGGYCGLGYVMRDPGPSFAPWAFQVTARSCAVGNLSWAHEHGHNMGMEHDPEDGISPPSAASYVWSYGHYVSGSFRTVMSYADPCLVYCPRVAHFSNPAVSQNGYPTGIADQRDNHRTANLTAAIVANFRAQVCSIDLDVALHDLTVTTAETYQACGSITVGPNVNVTGSGDLLLEAGERITLANGVSVQEGGALTAVIDPGVGAP